MGEGRLSAKESERPPPRGDVSAELHNYVKAWRLRLRPSDITGWAQYPARRRDRVTQEDVARLIGSTSYWYGELERGTGFGRYSDDFLNRVAIELKLTEAEREVLFRLAVGRPPPPVHTPSTEVSDVTRRIVDAYPIPAYISDVAWRVLYWNQHVSDWFPWLPLEPNVMRWTFTFPGARAQLAAWKTDWAPPMIAQMRFVHARFPDHPALNALIEEIRDVNEDARRLWDEDATVKMHPDGDRRRMYVPYRPDPIEVEIQSYAPHRDLTQRLILLVPLCADADPGIRIARRPDDPDREVYPAGPGIGADPDQPD